MILCILLILSGFILSSELLRKAPLIGDELEKMSAALSRFSKLLGAFTLILSLLTLFSHIIVSLVGIIVGLVLLIDHLDEVPGVGGPLKKLAVIVEPFDEWIGLSGVIIGLFLLF